MILGQHGLSALDVASNNLLLRGIVGFFLGDSRGSGCPTSFGPWGPQRGRYGCCFGYRSLGCALLLAKCCVDVICLPFPMDNANCRSYILDSREEGSPDSLQYKGVNPQWSSKMGNDIEMSKCVYSQ